MNVICSLGLVGRRSCETLISNSKYLGVGREIDRYREREREREGAAGDDYALVLCERRNVLTDCRIDMAGVVENFIEMSRCTSLSSRALFS